MFLPHPASFHVYETVTDRGEVGRIVAQALSDYDLFNQVIANKSPVADELSESVRSFFANRTVSISVVFGAQILVDIHHVSTSGRYHSRVRRIITSICYSSRLEPHRIRRQKRKPFNSTVQIPRVRLQYTRRD